MLNRHQARHIGKIPGVSCLPAFSCYIPFIKDIDTYIHLRCPRFAIYHRNDGLYRRPCRCKRRRGSCAKGKREHAFSLSAYKSADRERASFPFVCPAVCQYFFGQAVPVIAHLYLLCLYCFRAEYLLFYPYILIGASCQSMPRWLFCCKINVAWLAVANRSWRKSSLSLHSKRISAVLFAEKPFRPIPDAEK